MIPFSDFTAAAKFAPQIVPNAKLRVIYDHLPPSDLPGAAAELGVYKGCTARALCKAMPERRVMLFDTFTGIPEKGEDDVHNVGDFGDTSLEGVMRSLKDCSNADYRVGCFPEDCDFLLFAFAFIHLDFDQYKPTLAALQLFFPLLVKGGVIILDDWGWVNCPGVMKAALEYFGTNINSIGKAYGNQFVITK